MLGISANIGVTPALTLVLHWYLFGVDMRATLVFSLALSLKLIPNTRNVTSPTGIDYLYANQALVSGYFRLIPVNGHTVGLHVQVCTCI